MSRLLHRKLIMKVLIVTVLLLLLVRSSLSQKSSCRNLVFCKGELLHTIQMAGIFKDSKTFVDMSLVSSTERTLKKFEVLMSRTHGKPSKNEISDFVQKNFEASFNELENWYPTDHHPNPNFLRKITNPRIRNMAKKLVEMWPNLGRRIRPEVAQHPQKYTIIPVPNGFIVPGGRFREIYYWDSYWIIRGLLICDMKLTAKGMIENFFHIVTLYGFIPNGGRVYYLDRSQPPLLTLMVYEYMKIANDYVWLKQNIHYLETELNYWLNVKMITIDKNGKKYKLSRYKSTDDTPRPESYSEDVHTASRFRTDDEKRTFYTNVRTGAETGWDFSGRWFFDGRGGNRADLSTLKPTRIIPVDLNAFLCKSFKVMNKFYTKLRMRQKAKIWETRYKEMLLAITDVLYNEEDGIWYDYDVELRVPRKHFYPSNFAPLWTKSYNRTLKQEYGFNATNYLKMKGIMDFPGGVPTSLYETGEQWDLPNAWAPTQAFVIFGLDKTEEPGAVEAAEILSNNFVESLIQVAENTQEMFEKYNAQYKGMYGGGGEYEVQTGFGWTNGVMLELIEYYYIAKNRGEEN